MVELRKHVVGLRRELLAVADGRRCFQLARSTQQCVREPTGPLPHGETVLASRLPSRQAGAASVALTVSTREEGKLSRLPSRRAGVVTRGKTSLLPV